MIESMIFFDLIKIICVFFLLSFKLAIVLSMDVIYFHRGFTQQVDVLDEIIKKR